MLTLTRRQARDLRAVFRRRAFGLGSRGPTPPLVLRVGHASGLMACYRDANLAVAVTLPGEGAAGTILGLPLEALADLAGAEETAVTLEAASPGGTLARWQDRGIPRSCTHDTLAAERLPDVPDLPARWESSPGGLLDALAAAAATTDESNTRYALGYVQLRGAHGEVAATDGHQLLRQGGFRFPWDGDVLVRRPPPLVGHDLPGDGPVEVGRAERHVVLRRGPWTIWLATGEGRFPRLDDALPEACGPATRLQVNPADGRYLIEALGRLPGAREDHAPVTLDLNGRVAVRARGEGDERPTELVLARSRFDGPAVRFATNRTYLERALRLGFAEVRLAGPAQAAVCRDGRRTYGWQSLAREDAIAPADDAILIRSTDQAGGPAPSRACREEPRRPMNHAHHGDGNGRAPAEAATRQESKREPVQAQGLSALIQEAEALHTSLADAKLRAARLVAALRRHRRRTKLMESTLAALKQLKLQEAGA